jgi:hypothetical protein
MQDLEPLPAVPVEAWNSPGFCQVPNVLIDGALDSLGFAELKVILFIIRRTLGFNKLSDRISISQFEKGICTRDGRRLNRGTGLCRKSINRALDSLEENGLIRRSPQRSVQGGWQAPVYQVCFDAIRAYAAAQFAQPPKKAPQPLEPDVTLALVLLPPLMTAAGAGQTELTAEGVENEALTAESFENEVLMAENFENEALTAERFENESFENEGVEDERFEDENEDFEENLIPEIDLSDLNLEAFDKPDPWTILPIEALKAAEPDRSGPELAGGAFTRSGT